MEQDWSQAAGGFLYFMFGESEPLFFQFLKQRLALVQTVKDDGRRHGRRADRVDLGVEAVLLRDRFAEQLAPHRRDFPSIPVDVTILGQLQGVEAEDLALNVENIDEIHVMTDIADRLA